MQIKGFTFSAVKAGVRYQDRLDLGLIYSEKPVATAGLFTTSLVKAAPVIVDVERLENGVAQAILVNSGCANACTGEEGMATALETSKLLSGKLNIADNLIQLSSTGVIGEQLNFDAFSENMDLLIQGLRPEGFNDVAKAIMTTDTVHKTAGSSFDSESGEINIIGMAKGAGMIMPNMATMLAFIFTDAKITPSVLNNALTAANEKTFNRISVDGDTSTNDMVLIMANGGAGNKEIIDVDSPLYSAFTDNLEQLLKDLALQIVSDGEGATKTITIRVEGAVSEDDAEQIGRTVATSSLVKTAFFGEDANWGRIIGAMGRSGVTFDPMKVTISFGDVKLVENGVALGKEQEEEATKVLKQRDFSVVIDLCQGTAVAELYTCDFSIDYVKINSDYRS